MDLIKNLRSKLLICIVKKEKSFFKAKTFRNLRLCRSKISYEFEIIYIEITRTNLDLLFFKKVIPRDGQTQKTNCACMAYILEFLPQKREAYC